MGYFLGLSEYKVALLQLVDQFYLICDGSLGEDIGDVLCDCLFGNVQSIGNEFVGLSFDDKVYNFYLPACEVKLPTISFNQSFDAQIGRASCRE